MGILAPQGLPEHLAQARRTLVMGILNVTPDSFSDGGEHAGTAAAIAHGRALAAAGADLVDVGGESTRPGAARVDEVEESRRVLPVIRALAAEGIPLSVDTMRADVAEAALEAGALVLNDVSGGLADPRMAEVAASTRTRLGAPPVLVAMHWRGHSDVMRTLNRYQDVARDVSTELGERVARLTAAGVAREQLVVDPGIGFSKEGEQNWELLARPEHLASLGLPVLIGASRKRFLGELEPVGGTRDAAGGARQAAPAGQRDDATAAITAHAAMCGAWAVRVHQVSASAAAVRTIARIQAARA